MAETVPVNELQNGEVDMQDGEEGVLNSNELDVEAEAGSQSKEVRVIRKAKRINRTNSGGDATAVTSPGKPSHGHGAEAAKLLQMKNSRKSRDGRGRGDVKKGGAGGKGTWGAPGDELFADNMCDAKDPNYDSDSQGEYVVEKISPVVSAEDFDKMVTPIFLEYFDHGITKEVEASLEELNISRMRPRVVELAISLALDRKASHRELTSILISDLYARVISAKDIQLGFVGLLNTLNDLTIDSPEAPKLIGQFMARAVADDCLPPKFIQTCKNDVDNPAKREAVEKAELLLGQKHGIVRLDNIWGIGGGIRPVKYLIKQMVLLLKEYLSSSDTKEATRCLRELEVPHFHHELVYEATYMVIEDGSERSAQRMMTFLKSLYDTCIITPEQMAQGFKRVFDNMPDINLDVPNAYIILDRFAEMCHKNRVMSEKTFKDLPSGGRKRFVSEGDGGKVKAAVL